MSTEYRRYRRFPQGSVGGVETKTDRSTGVTTVSGSKSFTPGGDQTTWSKDTTFPLRRRVIAQARARGKVANIEDSVRDVGTSFTTISRTYRGGGAAIRPVSGFKSWVGADYRFSGHMMTADPTPGSLFSRWPVISIADLQDEMRLKGSTAIARTIPTNPSVDVANLIGESMQKLPSLPGQAILGRPGNVSKKFADEYLNVEFGLKPVISDIDEIASTIKNTNRILEKLKRDSGRLIRRRYRFPVESSRELVESGSSYSVTGPFFSAMYTGQGPWTRHRTVTKSMWFSGAYTYYYDQGQDLWSSLKRREQDANRLFGLRLSPSLAWELAPWSWAADWKSNAGDVISNISALSRDGLVLRWGYMMCTYSITDTYEQTWTLAGFGSVRSTQEFTTTVKARVKATPYGFGLDPDWKDFSPRQLAILGALGISRG